MYFIKEDHPDIEATLRVTSCATPKILNAGSAPLGTRIYITSPARGFPLVTFAENSYQNHLPKGIPLGHRFWLLYFIRVL